MDKSENNMLQLQSHANNEVKTMIVKELQMDKNFISSRHIDKIVDEANLDVSELSTQCENLYETGDTKKELAEKLLQNVKNNKKKFKIFSKLADEILKEGWCNKIND